jgi:ABC-2 type transport system ATP-binding protein
MGREQAERAIDHWLDVFGIADRRRSRVDELSKGNQQKVQVLASIIHEPDLALLDEPFSGLDPLNVELLMDALLTFKDRGKTVIFSSHQMGQVEEICEEVAIIARGRLVLAGNVRDIRDRATRRVVQVRTTSGRVPVVGLPLRVLESGREYQRFALDDGADAQDVLRAVAAQESVEYFSLERPSLQEIFIEVTTDAEAARTAGAAEPAPRPSAEAGD